jgi:hypothetical protein
MIAHANHQYNQKLQEMANAISREERRVEETKNCFKNWKKGFMTIISGGVTCILQDKELKKLRRNRDNLKNARNRFEGDVGPQLAQLDGLNVAANKLYSESLDKSKVVRVMEQELQLQYTKFNQKADKGTLFMKFEKLRNMMLTDLDNLINICNITINHT